MHNENQGISLIQGLHKVFFFTHVLVFLILYNEKQWMNEFNGIF